MKHLVFAFLSLLVTALYANAVQVTVTIQNLAPSSPVGMHFGPVWTGFHNGGFDFFDTGGTASGAVEMVAELGDSSAIAGALTTFQGSSLSMVTPLPGGPGPGLFTPGGSTSFNIDLDPVNNRYMSFATMVVPSNDWFVGNADPTAAEIFDAGMTFLGPQTWTIDGSMVYDAGTEVNDPTNGPAFVAGQDAMMGVSEGGSIGFVSDGDAFLGVTTAASTVIGQGLDSSPLFRVSVTAVPEPSTYALGAGLGVLLLALARRNRRASAPTDVKACG